jgi:hypothetical protein
MQRPVALHQNGYPDGASAYQEQRQVFAAQESF